MRKPLTALPPRRFLTLGCLLLVNLAGAKDPRWLSVAMRMAHGSTRMCVCVCVLDRD